MSTTMQARTKHPETELASYLSAPFVRMLIPNTEGEGYVAEVLELPGCLSEGETPEEAYRNLDEAMSGYIASLLDHNRPVPEPVGTKEYSGHFPLRMSTELHRAAALRAIQEGISLNQWIAKAITWQVAGQSIADEVVKKLRPSIAFQRYTTTTSGFVVLDTTSKDLSHWLRAMQEATPSLDPENVKAIEGSSVLLTADDFVTLRRESIDV